MDIRRLKREWTEPDNGKSSSGYWDYRSGDFGSKSIPTAENSDYIKLIKSKAKFIPGSTRILDIGCGSGIYSLAFAGESGPILGLDVSPKMIEYANKNAASIGAGNAVFKVADWLSMEDDDPLISGGFDLTIAHMTPAICSAETFGRMLKVSEGMCFFTGYISRGSAIRDRMREISSSERFTDSDKLINAIDMLWQMGIKPEIEYETRRFSFNRTLEETKEFYISDMRTYGNATDAMAAEAERYLESISEDGRVKDESVALIATVYWSMK